MGRRCILVAHLKTVVPFSCMLLIILIGASSIQRSVALCILHSLDEELVAAVLQDAMHDPAQACNDWLRKIYRDLYVWHFTFCRLGWLNLWISPCSHLIKQDLIAMPEESSSAGLDFRNAAAGLFMEQMQQLVPSYLFLLNLIDEVVQGWQ